MKYREIVRILEANGFTIDRIKGSHRQFKGVVGGVTQTVTVDFSQPSEDVMPRNLASMIRQSGLPKKLFR